MFKEMTAKLSPGRRKGRSRFLLTAFFTLCFLALLLLTGASAASAKVTGLVTIDDQGNCYSYDYEALLDSYAARLLGRTASLYDDFSSRPLYALQDSAKGYICYSDLLDRYAEALIKGSVFDLDSVTESGKVSAAAMPERLLHVSISGGALVRNELALGSALVFPAGGEGDTAADSSGQRPDAAPAPQPEIPQTVTPIAGAAEVSIEGARQWARSMGAHQRFVDIAEHYWRYGELTGLRPEVLYAQAALETGFGRFTGQVPPEFNNWAGIKAYGATGDEPEDHEQFASPEEGVRAHFNHLAAYVGADPIGEPHGRFHSVKRLSWAGSIETVEELSGRWAPSATYHVRIVSMIEQMGF